MVYRARILRVPVIDATKVITAVHQSHDYSHHPSGKAGVYQGAEAMQYRKLLGGRENIFGTHHATWLLTPQGMKRASSAEYLYHRMLAIPVLVTPLNFLNPPINLCLKLLSNLKRLVKLTFHK
jgi:hypothetical protein